MARHSRDRALAVVRPDCDVPQMGALMQVQSEQPLSWSGLGVWRGEPKGTDWAG